MVDDIPSVEGLGMLGCTANYGCHLCGEGVGMVGT